MSIADTTLPFFIYRKNTTAVFQLVAIDVTTNKSQKASFSDKLRVATEVPWDNGCAWQLAWVPTYGQSEIKKGYVSRVYNYVSSTCLILKKRDNPLEFYRVCLPRSWCTPERGPMEVSLHKFLQLDMTPYKPYLIRPTLLSANETHAFTVKELLKMSKTPSLPVEAPAPAPAPAPEPTTTTPTAKIYTVGDAFNTLSTKNKKLAMEKTTDLLWGIEECRGLMDLHGLQGWNLRISTQMICKAGHCIIHPNPAVREIALSLHMLSDMTVPRSEKRNVMLHEIAHALVPYSKVKGGHGPEWVAKAKEIGCTGERYHSMKFHPRLIAKKEARREKRKQARREALLCQQMEKLRKEPRWASASLDERRRMVSETIRRHEASIAANTSNTSNI